MKICKNCKRPEGEVKFSAEKTTICNACRGWDFRGMDGTPAHREAIAENNPVRQLSKAEIEDLAHKYEPPAKKRKRKFFQGGIDEKLLFNHFGT